MKAVEIRVRQLAELGDDLYGVDLMNKAFGQGGPLADPPAGGRHNDGPRSLSPAPWRCSAIRLATGMSPTTTRPRPLRQ
jgi:hypothetical protein